MCIVRTMRISDHQPSTTSKPRTRTNANIYIDPETCGSSLATIQNLVTIYGETRKRSF